jgi:hypothetical protein
MVTRNISTSGPPGMSDQLEQGLVLCRLGLEKEVERLANQTGLGLSTPGGQFLQATILVLGQEYLDARHRRVCSHTNILHTSDRLGKLDPTGTEGSDGQHSYSAATAGWISGVISRQESMRRGRRLSAIWMRSPAKKNLETPPRVKLGVPNTALPSASSSTRAV